VVTPSWGIHPSSTIDSGGNGSRVKPGTTVVFVLPIQLSNSPRDAHPRVVLAKARTHSHGSSWLRRAGHPHFFNNRQRWKWVPGQARDDSRVCSSDSNVKQRREYTSALSRRDAPELWVTFTLLSAEGAGKAGCALHPRSRVQNCAKKRTRAYRFSGNTPAFPARWVTAYFELSPVTGLFATVALRNLPPKLDASIGAPGPHDFTVRNSAVRRARDLRAGAAPSTASRPAFVTTRDPPLVRVRWGELVQLICPTV
jgi:hypothetical protein